MQSMTGIGFISINAKDFKLEITIKSVNSRFLDTKFYIPSYYIPLEIEMKKIISKKCQRGYFVIYIHRQPKTPQSLFSLTWNKKQSKKWKDISESIAKHLNVKNDLSISELIKKEGVIHIIEQKKSLNQKEKKKVKNCFSKAFQACLKERKREGQALKKDILSNIKNIQYLCKTIQTLNKKQKNKILKNTESDFKNKNRKLDSNFEIEKIDLHEEIIRIEEHLKHFKKMAESSDTIGKKLDFYVQEILRELNTIGSKSQLPKLTLKVIEGKFVLEKIKEQIQNIE